MAPAAGGVFVAVETSPATMIHDWDHYAWIGSIAAAGIDPLLNRTRSE